MQKRVPLFLLGLFLISFVSAQFSSGYGYGGYGFSLTDFFSRIDMQDAILFTMFVVILVLIGSILKKVGIFRDMYGYPDTKSIAIISLAVSLLSVYGLYRSGFAYDVEGFFYNLDISPTTLVVIIGIVLVIFVLRSLIKKGRLRMPTSI